MRWALGIGAASMAAAGLVAPEARACSPWDPELIRTFPAEGGVLPRGSALLLYGHVLRPEQLSVTVDGEPGQLLFALERSRGFWFFGWDWAYETMAFRIEPTPRPDQTIVITGDPCFQWEGMSYCDEVELVYTVGDPDVDAPDGPAELWYDVYDHQQEATTHSSCGNIWAQFEITIHTELEHQVLEYPLEYQLLRRPRAEPDAWALVEHDWLMDETAHDPTIRWQHLLEDVEAWLPLAEAFCLRLQTFDASMNLGGELEVCPPCHDQIGPGEEGGFIGWPDGYPSYDDASLVPDGHCPQMVAVDDSGGTTDDGGDDGGTTDDGGTSTGEPPEPDPGSSSGAPSADGVPDRGCACAATPTGNPWASLGGLLGLLLLGLRRRSVGRPVGRPVGPSVGPHRQR